MYMYMLLQPHVHVHVHVHMHRTYMHVLTHCNIASVDVFQADGSQRENDLSRHHREKPAEGEDNDG